MPTFRKRAKNKENIFKSVGKEDQREALRGDLKFNPPPGVSFRSHRLFALREETIVKLRSFASFFSLRSSSERRKKERARDQFKEISKRGDHFQKGNRKSASLCALSFGRSFPFAKKRSARERKKNCFVFASDALCATRAAHSYRRRRHQKQRDC